MNPGKELDLVIGKFMEWMWCDPTNLPHYSTSIKDAWNVVLRLESYGCTFAYTTIKEGRRGHFATIGYFRNPYDSFHQYVTKQGESAEHAICLAAQEFINAKKV